MERMQVTHFGITMKLRTRGYYLTRENYAYFTNRSTLGKSQMYIDSIAKNDEKLIDMFSKIYADSEGLVYSEEWCNKHRVEVMTNFDLNMKYFAKLDHLEFEKEVKRFLRKTKFVEISDLSNYCCSGYYVMILDKYCQVYIGTTDNIQKRIRQHWGGGKMRFDRLICGSVESSKLSIDSFRALDTTRIFVLVTNRTYHDEDKFINLFSDKYVCNRLNGGKIDDSDFVELTIVANVKTRELEQ